MAKRKKSKTKVVARRSGKLAGKKCPKPGIVVRTKGGLVGTTTGSCERRAPVVKVGGKLATFKRSELKKLTPREQKWLSADLQKFRSGRTPQVEVIKFPKRRATRGALTTGPDGTVYEYTKEYPFRRVVARAPQYVEHDVSHLPMDGIEG